jgi:hypothetical protein
VVGERVQMVLLILGGVVAVGAVVAGIVVSVSAARRPAGRVAGGRELSDGQLAELRKLDRSSAYVALWFGMFAVIVGIVFLALHLRGIL